MDQITDQSKKRKIRQFPQQNFRKPIGFAIKHTAVEIVLNWF